MCKQVEFKLEEYEFDSIQNVVFLKSYDISLPAVIADISKNGAIRVCVDALPSNINTGNSSRRILLTLSVAFSILSCVCLLITFLTYCFFGELRSLAGKTIMVLVSTIFVINIVSLVSYGGNRNNRKCIAVGILLHYFWLSSFTNMNICCFHMYRVFHDRIPLQIYNEKFLLIKYCIYIFLLPLCIVLGYFVTMFSVQGNVGYGKQDCFIDGKMALIFTFLIPTGFLCISNVFFFLQTIRTIKLSPTVSNNQPERNDFLICVRLFPITGVIWLLQILDGLLPPSYFTYIISVINTSQGVFIFLGFVFNKRTILMYKKIFTKKKKITKGTNLKSTCETPKMLKSESSCYTFDIKL
ncbi:adhesion G-protein coupled receptor G2-like [Saccostrea cucullata]|uniref:adhesion G-protein coupled receptor G2-like n=1 Tax=Saccostrea cuccullata TaxID=36930 RepID=UPI002ED3AD23